MSFRDSHSNGVLDQPITLAEVSHVHVVKAIKNNKSAGSDGIVGELIKKLKYGSTFGWPRFKMAACT